MNSYERQICEYHLSIKTFAEIAKSRNRKVADGSENMKGSRYEAYLYKRQVDILKPRGLFGT